MSGCKVKERIKIKVYELKHLRYEGFDDKKSLESMCVINEIKFLFNMLDESDKKEILTKTWLD